MKHRPQAMRFLQFLTILVAGCASLMLAAQSNGGQNNGAGTVPAKEYPIDFTKPAGVALLRQRAVDALRRWNEAEAAFGDKACSSQTAEKVGRSESSLKEYLDIEKAFVEAWASEYRRTPGSTLEAQKLALDRITQLEEQDLNLMQGYYSELSKAVDSVNKEPLDTELKQTEAQIRERKLQLAASANANQDPAGQERAIDEVVRRSGDRAKALIMFSDYQRLALVMRCGSVPN